MSKSVKHDSEKPRMDLVLGGFSKALIEVGKVGTWGAIKHGDNTWQGIDNAVERYASAGLRHWAESKKDPYDSETKLLHAAHKAWNALAELELIINELHEVPKFKAVIDHNVSFYKGRKVWVKDKKENPWIPDIAVRFNKDAILKFECESYSTNYCEYERPPGAKKHS